MVSFFSSASSFVVKCRTPVSIAASIGGCGTGSSLVSVAVVGSGGVMIGSGGAVISSGSWFKPGGGWSVGSCM
eukprot:3264733-Amphidinium_carterae.7